MRNPYIDPMNYVQVALLRRLRGSPGADDEEIHDAVRLSVNGIAAGLGIPVSGYDEAPAHSRVSDPRSWRW